MKSSAKHAGGEIFSISSALLGGLFPVITVLTFRTLPPILTASIVTGLSALLFAGILTVTHGWGPTLSRADVRDIAVVALVIGFVYYALSFLGLRYTTPGNASIVSFMEVFFTFLFLNVLTKHEPFVPRHLVGGMCMVAGASLILLPHSSGWYSGDLIVLFAAMFPPLANAAAQRVRRRHVSSTYILFWRAAVAAPLLFILSRIFESSAPLSIDLTGIMLLLVSGLLNMGLSKMFWMEALHRMPVTKSLSVLSIQPLFTLFFAYIFLRQSATTVQLLSLVPMAAGMFLLMKRPRKMEIQSSNDLFNG